MSLSLEYDFAVAGAGASGTYVLLSLLDRLAGAAGMARSRIAVFDDAASVGAGVAYSGRAHFNSLMIERLGLFLPEAELIPFERWLRQSGLRLLRSWMDEAPESLAHWHAINRARLEREAYREIYFPRRLFGVYLRGRLDCAIVRARRAGVIVDFIDARVHAVTRRAGGAFELQTAAATAQSRVVLLAVGFWAEPDRWIADPYAPSLAQTIATVRTLSQAPGEPPLHVTLVGANAAALDVLYAISCDPALIARLGGLAVVAPHGKLPALMERPGQDLEAPGETPPSEPPGDVEALIQSIARLAADYRAAGKSVWSFAAPLTSEFAARMMALPSAERQSLLGDYSVAFMRSLRRTSYEYADRIRVLASSGQLRVATGRLTTDHRLEFSAADGASVQPPQRGLVIDCRGPATADREGTLSSFNGIAFGPDLVRVNGTRRGLVVNERFEASENLFVYGPLLTGLNWAARFYWHFESLARIAEGSAEIAHNILEAVSRSRESTAGGSRI